MSEICYTKRFYKINQLKNYLTGPFIKDLHKNISNIRRIYSRLDFLLSIMELLILIQIKVSLISKFKRLIKLRQLKLNLARIKEIKYLDKFSILNLLASIVTNKISYKMKRCNYSQEIIRKSEEKVMIM